MAEIIKKGHQLEEKFRSIERERADKRAKGAKEFVKFVFAVIVVFGIFFAIGIAVDIFLIVFKPLLIGLGVCLFIVGLVCINFDFSTDTNTDILVSGINGERTATEILLKLPDGYTIFQNATIIYEGKTSEIDNIVVGRSGVFIVEVKNHNGNITGDYRDTYWTQYKVGRGGTPYSKEIYSPVKQVGTHIYRLANYLRDNGVNTYIEGIVYFTNKKCVVRITGNSSTIPVYTCFDGDEARLFRRILTGEHILSGKSINHICKLLNQL